MDKRSARSDYFRRARAEERKYAHRVGTIGIKWARLHSNLIIFGTMLGRSNPDRSHLEAMKRIGKIANDERARQEIRKLVLEARVEPRVRDGLLWVLDQVKRLEGQRNGFVHHAAFMGGYPVPKVTLDPMGLMDRYHEVRNDPEKAYRALRADLEALLGYAVGVTMWTAKSDFDFPGRPRIQTLELFPHLR